MTPTEWPDSISGFSRDRWHRFIVCTNHDQHFEVLGMIFDHVDGDTRWSPRVIYLNNEGSEARVLIHHTNLDDEQRAEVRARGVSGMAYYGHGSMLCECPQGCEHRVPEDTWWPFITAARHNDLEWVDLSRYS